MYFAKETTVEQEAIDQIGTIYDKLEQLPAGKRSIVVLMIDAFINGMSAQERLSTE